MIQVLISCILLPSFLLDPPMCPLILPALLGGSFLPCSCPDAFAVPAFFLSIPTLPDTLAFLGYS